MKKLLILAGVCILLASNALTAGNGTITPAVTKGKKVVVYTTAENTKLRISATDTVSFVAFGKGDLTDIGFWDRGNCEGLASMRMHC